MRVKSDFKQVQSSPEKTTERQDEMKRFRQILAVAMIAGMQMTFVAIRAAGAGTGDVVIATNKVVNYYLPKSQPSVTFVLTNGMDEPYLWIMAHGCDTRKIEHSACPLRIEVNGVALDKDRSILQGQTYRYPAHPTHRQREFDKFDENKKAWAFKYDVDFIMNNQTGSHNNWGIYTTLDYNHWYAFDLQGLARVGVNEVRVLEQIPPDPPDSWAVKWKSICYDGVQIGEISLCSENEIKMKIAEYNREQIIIPAEELEYVNVIRNRYKEVLKVPKGRAQRMAIRDGYITKDGKPFFLAYLNSFSDAIGRETVFDIYSYYTLITVTMTGAGCWTSREIMNLPIYLKDGWDAYRVADWEMPILLGNMFIAYQRGFLSLPYLLDNQGGLPYLEKYFPETLVQDPSGKIIHRTDPEKTIAYPNFAQPKYREFLRQMYTIFGRTFKNHPALFGYSVWEEQGWRLPQETGLAPQGPLDVPLYHAFLLNKYQTIDRLNSEWNTSYADFSKIACPKQKEQSANLANFQAWRSKMLLEASKTSYETLKEADPQHLVMGQKTYGDVYGSHGYWMEAIDNWGLTEYVDISREYSSGSAMAQLGRSSCAAFTGKVMEADCGLGPEPYRILDKPAPWHLWDQGQATYPWMMQMLFNGNRAIHWEIYDLARAVPTHFIHYNKRWKNLERPATTCDGAREIRMVDAGSADVLIPEKTLNVARLHQWCIRNASLLLPSRVIKPDVAVLTLTNSRMIGHDPHTKLHGTPKCNDSWVDNVGQDFDMLGILFDHLHLQFDCIEERTLNNIFDYKVLIAGYQANMGNAVIADKIKAFLRQGGTVIFYPEAFSWRDRDFGGLEESPGFGLSELCCARIDNRQIVSKHRLMLKDSRFTPTMNAGEMLCEGEFFAVNLQQKTNAVVLAVAEDGAPVLVSDSMGKCFYFGGYLGLNYHQSYPQHVRFAQLWDDILKRGGVEKAVKLELPESLEARFVFPALLEGKDYWLAGINNFSSADQRMTVKINRLPEGNYEMIDISGERPVMVKSEDGNFHLKPNFEEAQPKYVARMPSGWLDDKWLGARLKYQFSAEQLRKKGFEATVPGYYSKVWLIRPMGKEVWVNATEEALKSYVELKKPLKIVTGSRSNGEEEKCVEELRNTLEKRGVQAEVVKDDAIKRKAVEGRLVEDGYELEKYRHEVIDDEANLILIGNAEENSVVKHLQTAGNYAYCKVPEMLSGEYPGKGRGVIQIVESINAISYDATGKSRDAILAGGSDRKGTEKAVHELIKIIRIN